MESGGSYAPFSARRLKAFHIFSCRPAGDLKFNWNQISGLQKLFSDAPKTLASS